MHKILLIIFNIIILITVALSSVLGVQLFDYYIIFKFFTEGRTFQAYFGVVQTIHLISLIPSIIIYAIYGIIVFLAVQTENKKIWSVLAGILASAFFFFMRKSGFSEHADVIDYIYSYLAYFAPLFGFILGTLVVVKAKKSITRC